MHCDIRQRHYTCNMNAMAGGSGFRIEHYSYHIYIITKRLLLHEVHNRDFLHNIRSEPKDEAIKIQL